MCCSDCHESGRFKEAKVEAGTVTVTTAPATTLNPAALFLDSAAFPPSEWNAKQRGQHIENRTCADLPCWRTMLLLISQGITDHQTDPDLAVAFHRSENNSGVVTLKEEQRKRTPARDFFEWLVCFTRYAQTYLQRWPDDGPGMMAFVGLVAEWQRANPWWWVLKIEEAHRALYAVPTGASTGKLQWGVVDEAGLARYRLAIPQIQAPAAAASSGGFRGGDRRPVSSKPDQRRACFDWNGGTGAGRCTRGGSCRFPHVCQACGKDHRMVDSPDCKKRHEEQRRPGPSQRDRGPPKKRD
jgi:hypothetical protein